jgi:hypothetical protein
MLFGVTWDHPMLFGVTWVQPMLFGVTWFQPMLIGVTWVQPKLIGSVSVAHLFSLLCYVFVPHLVKILSTSLAFIPGFKLWGSCCILCHILCLYVLGSMLWCPLRFPHENDVLFVFPSGLYCCVCLRILVSYMLFYHMFFHSQFNVVMASTISHTNDVRFVSTPRYL